MQLSFHEVREGRGRVSGMSGQILSCMSFKSLYTSIRIHLSSFILIFVRSNISGKGTNGGAIRTEIKTNINIENSRFMANQADAHGGAIYNKGILKLHNSTLNDNAATMVCAS